MEERKCQECGTEIYGRIDKKFCSDQCRNTFNNRTHAIANSYIRKVNYTIRKNRKIMEDLLISSDKDAIKIKKSKLFDLGFSFEYYTNIYKTKTGNYYYFCYEYGFMKIDEEYFTVVKREEYLQ